jgi:hypothetical protein
MSPAHQAAQAYIDAVNTTNLDRLADLFAVDHLTVDDNGKIARMAIA